jgi:pantoate kinase
MKTIAFAPGHISGFFEPVFKGQDLERSGSRGAGINITFGSVSEVSIEPTSEQSIIILINGKNSQAPVTRLAIKYMVADTSLKIKVSTHINLPMGQGFGMSGAGALSTVMALAESLKLSRDQAIKAAHFAEVQLHTGLGDVIASSFGGIEIRKQAGLPPWGMIEHIPGIYEIVLCVIGKKMSTKKILSDGRKLSEIASYGRYCTKKLLEKPSLENFFALSQTFTEKIDVADKKVIEAIQAANQYGMASMCMLGNSVFAIGNTSLLCDTLTQFGKVFVCHIDTCGARNI